MLASTGLASRDLVSGAPAGLAAPPEGGEGFGFVATPSPTPQQVVEQQRAEREGGRAPRWRYAMNISAFTKPQAAPPANRDTGRVQ